jgi:hypothetical protein
MTYLHAEYKVLSGSKEMAEIKQVMRHLDSYTEEELNLLDDAEILQMWVNNILDNQIENDVERLGEMTLTETGAKHPLGRSVCELRVFVEHPPSWDLGQVVDELMRVVNEITEDTRIIILATIKK